MEYRILPHGGDKVSVFYGNDALKYAYEAARDSGDVITLSAGLFNALEIQKSLHIIGNGFVKDEANGKYPTIIKGDLTFKPGDVTDDDGETTSEVIGYDGTRIEGIMHIGYDRENIELLGSRTVKDFSSSESDTPSTAAKVSPLRWYFFTRFDACKIMLLSPVLDG